MEILEIILIYLIVLLDIKLDFETKNNNIKIEYNGLVWVTLGFLTNNICKWFYLDVSSKT